MTTRNLRSALLGSAVGVGLLVSGGQAHALSTEFGELKIFFDTTVSVGVQMKTKDARQAFLTEFNGGNPDLRTNLPGTVVSGNAAAAGSVVTAPVTITPGFSANALPGSAGPPVVAPAFFSAGSPGSQNFDDSPNTDDRFLNFGAGDLTSANIKANHDLQMTWRNFTLFARATEFYDFVLNSDGAYNRFGIDDNNKEEVGRDVRLLDLYLSADFDVGSLPVNFRAGKQVISWGEGTFIFNGINSVNPIDVSAFRRPGVEIKEGLIPVWALYGSVGLPFDLSLEAFYQLDWEPFQLDPAGTPFAGSDVANSNSSFGGNQGLGFYSGSIRNGFNLRNCTGTGPTQQAAAAVGALAGYNSLVGTGCTTSSFQHFATDLPTDGSAQGILVSGFGGAGVIADRGDARLLGTSRGADTQAKDEGQWGVALRWYSEDLNSTEFGFYYMKYHSRLPIAQVEAAGVPQVQVGVTSPGTVGTKFVTSLGCFGAGAGSAATIGNNGILTPVISGGGDFLDPALRNGGFGETSVIYDDPNNTVFNLRGIAQAVYAGNATALADVNAITAGSANLRQVALVNCAILGLTGQTVPGSAVPIAPDGTETITVQQNLQTRLIYPEDIELWGLSFNTTIGDWGVQGEFSYRPNQPLQVDTTQQTISAAGSQCVGLGTFGDSNTFILSQLSTEPGTQANIAQLQSSCRADNFNNGSGSGFTPTAFVREEVFTFQIGTTATYTSSNPLIDFLGADIGVLVTEFGLVHIPGVHDEPPITGPGSGDTATGGGAGTVQEFNRLSEVCRSGTALPLGSILALDTRAGCTPTETSYGGILLTRLDYNNAFGTAWTVSPQLVYRHDFEGVTPAPLGNYIEDRRSLGFSVTANLQNTWTVGLSYTDFMGSEQFQSDLDDDFVSLTASYSF